MDADYLVDLERSVLGAVLLSCDEIPPGVDMLTPHHFLSTAHRKIWEAMLVLSGKREPIDTITVGNAMQGVTPAPSDGWGCYLSDLTEETPTAANVGHYANALQAALRRRDFIAACSRTLEKAKDGKADGDDLLTELVTELSKLAESRITKRPVSLKGVVHEEYKAMETRAAGGMTGLASGFEDFDAMTGGFSPGTLNIVAGRPGMGKTAFVNNIVQNCCVDRKHHALIFNLEMANVEQAQRYIAADSWCDLRRIRSGTILDRDWPKLAKAAGRLYTDRVYLFDEGDISIADLRSMARQHKLRHQIDLIVVDYLQLMNGPGESREREVSNISRGLKALAKELEVPIIALSQLNRSVEARADKRPMLSDLRESGSLEQDADLVVFLYRDDYYNPNSDQPGICEIGFAKQRNGPTGMRRLRWFGWCTRFTDLGKSPPPTIEKAESEYEYEN